MSARWASGLVAVAVMAALTGCAGTTSEVGAPNPGDSSGSTRSSAAPSPGAATPPRLGQPSTNTLKGNWEPVTVGCTRYEVAPTLADSDPVTDLRLFNTCGKSLQVKQARAAVPKGKTACLRELPTSGIGPHVELRFPDEFTPCQETEKKVTGTAS